MLTLDKLLIPNKAKVAAKVMDGEAIFIDLSNGTYYSTDGVGGFVWSLIEQEYDLDAIIAEVIAHYHVSSEQAMKDVERLAAKLIEEQLVKVVDKHKPVSKSTDRPAKKSIYKTPELNTYRDMEDLLALDPPMPDLTDIPWEGTKDLSSGEMDD